MHRRQRSTICGSTSVRLPELKYNSSESKCWIRLCAGELIFPLVISFLASFAGDRVGCAGLASAANGEVKNGETTFLLTTLRSLVTMGWKQRYEVWGELMK